MSVPHHAKHYVKCTEFKAWPFLSLFAVFFSAPCPSFSLCCQAHQSPEPYVMKSVENTHGCQMASEQGSKDYT